MRGIGGLTFGNRPTEIDGEEVWRGCAREGLEACFEEAAADVEADGRAAELLDGAQRGGRKLGVVSRLVSGS